MICPLIGSISASRFPAAPPTIVFPEFLGQQAGFCLWKIEVVWNTLVVEY
jgi:hypothetical protein